ncbi:MAG: TonB-dependent receptor, partial [Acidobacteria bacterium]|nr:TonB-dependent receptor [Acidobacteriota bacterium]
MRRLATFFTVVALVGAAATPALAQQGRTELQGAVLDETGGALPGVTVFIQNEADGTFREVITGADGSYFAAQLLPGVFTVTAALPGFATFQTTGYELRVGATVPLDIVLGVGALEETVTVSGQAPLVDLTSAEVGGTLDSQELTEMPLQNRSAFAAISLLPGIQFLPSESSGNDTIIANGQTAAASNLNVDGGYNGDSTSGGAGGSQVKVAIESVQEFQVVSGQFDAEFGRSSGAVINAVTKRGTNQWSGAGFSYSTSTNMTARNYFNAQQALDDPSVEKPTNNKYEFGGVFGGPIVQDKAHFFVSLERRLNNPARATTFSTRPELSWSSPESWRAL